MLKLNSIGAILGSKPFVHSITDVTGFGLCGHLIEMCEASNLNALLHYVKLPVLDPCVLDYIQQELFQAELIETGNHMVIKWHLEILNGLNF